jgi:predicted phosphodiesterase
MAFKIIFLSDIHIGPNSRLNWYQKSVHQPYLLAALEYVLRQGKRVQDLVLLGDLVDQWTEDPNNKPPGFGRIVDDNPDVFRGSGGNPGLLVQCLDSVSGQVCYVNGNHDMFVTKQDMSYIRTSAGKTPLPAEAEETLEYVDPNGKHVRYILSAFYSARGTNGGVVGLHGHQFSMTCAPDWREDPKGTGHHGGLPLAFYVTRLAARWAGNQLDAHYPKGSTVADMPNTGYPAGWNVDMQGLDGILKAIEEDILHFREPSLSQIMLEALAKVAGVSLNQTFQMFPGYETINVKQAINQYKDLFSDWANAYGYIHAGKVLVDTDLRDTLGPFAKNVAENMGIKHPVVIMGHTHVPIDNKNDPWFSDKYIYANSGFNCPSLPDMKRVKDPKSPTFAEVLVDDTNYVVTILKVGPPPNYTISVDYQRSIKR